LEAITLTIIERIVNLLDEKNVPQKEICDLLGIKSSTFSTWKKRFTSIPAEYIIPIADHLKVPVRYILSGEGAQELVDLTEQEEELLKIFKSLSIKDKTALLSKAYELEEHAK
jgi:transcriptional regulator with XRE-family HTH domain